MRQEFGNAGHFCGSRNCRFRRHTHTRDYCISTVGYWVPSNSPVKDLGNGYLYETMVFELKRPHIVGLNGSPDHEGSPDGCPDHDGVEIHYKGYKWGKWANIGHESIVDGCMQREALDAKQMNNPDPEQSANTRTECLAHVADLSNHTDAGITLEHAREVSGLRAHIRALAGIIRRNGGYMVPGDQGALFAAEQKIAEWDLASGRYYRSK